MPRRKKQDKHKSAKKENKAQPGAKTNVSGSNSTSGASVSVSGQSHQVSTQTSITPQTSSTAADHVRSINNVTSSGAEPCSSSGPSRVNPPSSNPHSQSPAVASTSGLSDGSWRPIREILNTERQQHFQVCLDQMKQMYYPPGPISPGLACAHLHVPVENLLGEGEELPDEKLIDLINERMNNFSDLTFTTLRNAPWVSAGIYFNRESKTYLPGESVIGFMEINVGQQSPHMHLKLIYRAMAHVNTSMYQKYDPEDFLDDNFTGSFHVQGSSVTLWPINSENAKWFETGHHGFHFSFPLPITSPQSFTEYGGMLSIEYDLVLEIRLSDTSVYYESLTSFTVTPMRNMDVALQKPVVIATELPNTDRSSLIKFEVEIHKPMITATNGSFTVVIRADEVLSKVPTILKIFPVFIQRIGFPNTPLILQRVLADYYKDAPYETISKQQGFVMTHDIQMTCALNSSIDLDEHANRLRVLYLLMVFIWRQEDKTPTLVIKRHIEIVSPLNFGILPKVPLYRLQTVPQQTSAPVPEESSSHTVVTQEADSTTSDNVLEQLSCGCEECESESLSRYEIDDDKNADNTQGANVASLQKPSGSNSAVLSKPKYTKNGACDTPLIRSKKAGKRRVKSCAESACSNKETYKKNGKYTKQKAKLSSDKGASGSNPADTISKPHENTHFTPPILIETEQHADGGCPEICSFVFKEGLSQAMIKIELPEMCETTKDASFSSPNEASDSSLTLQERLQKSVTKGENTLDMQMDSMAHNWMGAVNQQVTDDMVRRAKRLQQDGSCEMNEKSPTKKYKTPKDGLIHREVFTENMTCLDIEVKKRKGDDVHVCPLQKVSKQYRPKINIVTDEPNKTPASVNKRPEDQPKQNDMERRLDEPTGTTEESQRQNPIQIGNHSGQNSGHHLPNERGLQNTSAEKNSKTGYSTCSEDIQDEHRRVLGMEESSSVCPNGNYSDPLTVSGFSGGNVETESRSERQQKIVHLSLRVVKAVIEKNETCQRVETLKETSYSQETNESIKWREDNSQGGITNTNECDLTQTVQTDNQVEEGTLLSHDGDQTIDFPITCERSEEKTKFDGSVETDPLNHFEPIETDVSGIEEQSFKNTVTDEINRTIATEENRPHNSTDVPKDANTAHPNASDTEQTNPDSGDECILSAVDQGGISAQGSTPNEDVIVSHNTVPECDDQTGTPQSSPRNETTAAHTPPNDPISTSPDEAETRMDQSVGNNSDITAMVSDVGTLDRTQDAEESLQETQPDKENKTPSTEDDLKKTKPKRPRIADRFCKPNMIRRRRRSSGNDKDPSSDAKSTGTSSNGRSNGTATTASTCGSQNGGQNDTSQTGGGKVMSRDRHSETSMESSINDSCGSPSFIHFGVDSHIPCTDANQSLLEGENLDEHIGNMARKQEFKQDFETCSESNNNKTSAHLMARFTPNGHSSPKHGEEVSIKDHEDEYDGGDRKSSLNDTIALVADTESTPHTYFDKECIDANQNENHTENKGNMDCKQDDTFKKKTTNQLSKQSFTSNILTDTSQCNQTVSNKICGNFDISSLGLKPECYSEMDASDRLRMKTQFEGITYCDKLAAGTNAIPDSSNNRAATKFEKKDENVCQHIEALFNQWTFDGKHDLGVFQYNKLCSDYERMDPIEKDLGCQQNAIYNGSFSDLFKANEIFLKLQARPDDLKARIPTPSQLAAYKSSNHHKTNRPVSPEYFDKLLAPATENVSIKQKYEQKLLFEGIPHDSKTEATDVERPKTELVDALVHLLRVDPTILNPPRRSEDVNQDKVIRTSCPKRPSELHKAKKDTYPIFPLYAHPNQKASTHFNTRTPGTHNDARSSSAVLSRYDQRDKLEQRLSLQNSKEQNATNRFPFRNNPSGKRSYTNSKHLPDQKYQTHSDNKRTIGTNGKENECPDDINNPWNTRYHNGHTNGINRNIQNREILGLRQDQNCSRQFVDAEEYKSLETKKHCYSTRIQAINIELRSYHWKEDKYEQLKMLEEEVKLIDKTLAEIRKRNYHNINRVTGAANLEQRRLRPDERHVPRQPHFIQNNPHSKPPGLDRPNNQNGRHFLDSNSSAHKMHMELWSGIRRSRSGSSEKVSPRTSASSDKPRLSKQPPQNKGDQR